MNQPKMPSLEQIKQTISNSQKQRRELETAGLKLKQVITQLEQHNRQQRLQRLRTSSRIPD
jgi:hypothetical protein